MSTLRVQSPFPKGVAHAVEIQQGSEYSDNASEAFAANERVFWYLNPDDRCEVWEVDQRGNGEPIARFHIHGAWTFMCAHGSIVKRLCGECGEYWPCTQSHRTDRPPHLSAAHFAGQSFA